MSLEQHRAAIRHWMLAGRSVDWVEREVIDSQPELTADEKAALWLYAWSFVGLDRQRDEAIAHMQRLEAVHD